MFLATLYCNCDAGKISEPSTKEQFKSNGVPRKIVEDPKTAFEEDYRASLQFFSRLLVRNSGVPHQHRSVLITAPWGMGKTTFKDLLKKNLAESKPSPITIDFNVWRYSSSPNIIHDLLSQIQKEVLDQLQIVQFSDWLFQSISSKLGIHNVFLEGKDAQHIIDKISHFLDKKKSHLVVFLDELDRLDKEELNALFKVTQILKSIDRCSVVAFMALGDFMGQQSALSSSESSDSHDQIKEKFKKEFLLIEPLVQSSEKALRDKFEIFQIIEIENGRVRHCSKASPKSLYQGINSLLEEESIFKESIGTLGSGITLFDLCVFESFTYRDLERAANSIMASLDFDNDSQTLYEYCKVRDVILFALLKSWFPEVVGRLISKQLLFQANPGILRETKDNSLVEVLRKTLFVIEKPKQNGDSNEEPKQNGYPKEEPQLIPNPNQKGSRLFCEILIRLFPNRTGPWFFPKNKDKYKKVELNEIQYMPNFIRATQLQWPTYLPTKKETEEFENRVNRWTKTPTLSIPPTHEDSQKLGILIQGHDFHFNYNANEHEPWLQWIRLLLIWISAGKVQDSDTTDKMVSSLSSTVFIITSLIHQYWQVAIHQEEECIKTFWQIFAMEPEQTLDQEHPNSYWEWFAKVVLSTFMPASKSGRYSTWIELSNVWDEYDKAKSTSIAQNSLVYFAGKTNVDKNANKVLKKLMNGSILNQLDTQEDMPGLKTIILWSSKYQNENEFKSTLMDIEKNLENKASFYRTIWMWFCLNQPTKESPNFASIFGNLIYISKFKENGQEANPQIVDLLSKTEEFLNRVPEQPTTTNVPPVGWDWDLAAEILYKFPKEIRTVFSHESSRPQK